MANATVMANQDCRDCKMTEKIPNSSIPLNINILVPVNFLDFEFHSNVIRNKKQAPDIKEPCCALR
ncbi:hypothetical protein D3C85_1774540 [compost metagenome]